MRLKWTEKSAKEMVITEIAKQLTAGRPLTNDEGVLLFKEVERLQRIEDAVRSHFYQIKQAESSLETVRKLHIETECLSEDGTT